MLPYYLLVFIPFSVYMLGLYKGKNYNRLCISIFFLILLLLLSMRSVNTGIDLKNYKYFFNSISNLSLHESLNYSEKGEPLFYLLNKVISIISNNNFQVFLTVVAIISILPIYLFYYNKSDNALLTIALFLTVAPFTIFFSGLRQSIAIGIIVFSFKYIENNKIIKFIIYLLIAFFFHRSAIFCLPLYLVYHIKINKNSLYIIIPLMILIFLFNQQIFTAILSFTTLYDGKIEITGAYSILILLILFAIYCFSFPSNEKIDSDFIGLRNILLFSIIIQMFAPIHPTIMRVNYYYLLFIPILISKTIKVSNINLLKILNVSYVIMTIFFIFYFFYTGYTGDDILHIFPYIPFWEVKC